MTATTQDFWTEIRRNQGFEDAVAGIKLLTKFHGVEGALEMAAFDIEVQRAVRGGNSAAAFCGLERVRGEQFSAEGTASDGDIVRALMQACGIFGDYIFVPAVAAAALEDLHRLA
jgi:hypothetical protein